MCDCWHAKLQGSPPSCTATPKRTGEMQQIDSPQASRSTASGSIGAARMQAEVLSTQGDLVSITTIAIVQVGDAVHNILVENAADESVCPPRCMLEYPMQDCLAPSLCAANDEKLKHSGKKTASVTKVSTGLLLTLQLMVADVHGPIFAVGR